MRNSKTSAVPSVRAIERRKARGLLACLWRVADALEYLVTLAALCILDALAGPEPEPPADQQREREWIESPRLTVVDQ
jgi:hypothetical protein